MLRRSTALALLIAASLGVTACGGSEQTGDVVPGDTPELVPPGEGSGTLPAAPTGDQGTTADDGTTTSTTATTDTTATGSGGTVAPSTGGTAATPAPQATAAPQATPTPQTGGAGAGGTDGSGEAGGFQDFCTQNPGACDN